MWILKFQVIDKKNELTEIVIKNQVKVYYYPVNHYVKKNRYYFIAIGILEGNESNKKQFFKDLKKLKKVKTGRRLELLEVEGDFFVGITSHTIDQESKLFIRVIYNPSIIHFQPAIFHKDGWEEFNIASAEKDDIKKIIQAGEKVSRYEFKFLQFTNKKIKNFGFLTILPELTLKQKQAIELAIKNGYYEYPRQIELEKLAKLSGISLSTYHAHLRKAERKLLPFIMKRFT